MSVNMYYNVVFARASIGKKVKGYLVHNCYKNPRLLTSMNFNDVGIE